MQDVADAWRGYADVTDEHRVPPRQEGQGHDTPRSPRALTQQLRLRSQRARELWNARGWAHLQVQRWLFQSSRLVPWW